MNASKLLCQCCHKNKSLEIIGSLHSLGCGEVDGDRRKVLKIDRCGYTTTCSCN